MNGLTLKYNTFSKVQLLAWIDCREGVHQITLITQLLNLTECFVLLCFLESKRAGGPNFQSMYDVHGFIVVRKPRSAKIIYTSAHGLDNQKRGDLSKRAFYFNELEMVPLGTLNELISAGCSVWRTTLAIISVSMMKRCRTIFHLHYHLFRFSYFTLLNFDS